MATLRQKLAVSKLSENLRNSRPFSMGRILRDAGYSESVARHLDIVTGSAGWLSLMKECFPDETIVKLHSELLDAQKITNLYGETFVVPDNRTRLKALDMLYKIIGLYSAEKYQIQKNPYDNMTDEEIEAEIKKLEGEKLQSYGEYFQKLDEIKQLQQDQVWLVQKGKKGIIPDDLLKKQLAEIENKLTLAQMGLDDTHREKITIENLLAEAYTFIRTPEIAWYNALPEAQVKYQRLIFPSGITYEFPSLSNQELGLPFKLITDIGSQSPTDVGALGIEPRTSYLSDKRSTTELRARIKIF